VALNCPELVIRSTFIVDFSGETEEEFEELLSFLEEAQLDRVGCFKYSPVEGATANALAKNISFLLMLSLATYFGCKLFMQTNMMFGVFA